MNGRNTKHITRNTDLDRRELAGSREERARALAHDVVNLQKAARCKDDYDILSYKLRKIRDLYLPRWTLRGELSDLEHLVSEYSIGGYVHAASFSSDGRRLVVGGRDGRVHCIDVVHGKPVSQHTREVFFTGEEYQPSWILSASFDRTGDSIVVGTADDIMFVLKSSPEASKKGRLLFSYHVEARHITDYRGFDTCFSPGGGMVALGTHDCLMLLSLLQARGETPGLLARVYEDQQIMTVQFSPDGKSLLIGTDEGRVKVLSVAALKSGKTKVIAETCSESAVWSARFNPSGDMVLTGSNDGLVQLLRLDNNKKNGFGTIHEFNVDGLVEAIDFHPWGDKIVYGTSKGFLQVLSLDSISKGERSVVAEYDSSGQWISVANFSPRGDMLVVGCGSNIKLFGSI